MGRQEANREMLWLKVFGLWLFSVVGCFACGGDDGIVVFRVVQEIDTRIWYL